LTKGEALDAGRPPRQDHREQHLGQRQEHDEQSDREGELIRQRSDGTTS
jgi:hypothetical protein